MTLSKKKSIPILWIYEIHIFVNTKTPILVRFENFNYYLPINHNRIVVKLERRREKEKKGEQKQ